MREVRRLGFSYSDDNYVSIFVGICKSQELLYQYLQKDYELLEYDYIGFELGIDFGINTYDEDFAIVKWNEQGSDSIDTIFNDMIIFDIDQLKANYPHGLNQFYNVAIVIGQLKYEGKVKEVHNDEFGYFKFLGTFKVD